MHARIGTLVYGAAEPKSGAVVSTVRAGELPGLNHRFAMVSGVREDECRALVQAFFRERAASDGCAVRYNFGSDTLHYHASGEVPKWS